MVRYLQDAQKTRLHTYGFTLVETLIGLTIIAVLATDQILPTFQFTK